MTVRLLIQNDIVKTFGLYEICSLDLSEVLSFSDDIRIQIPFLFCLQLYQLQKPVLAGD